MPSLRLEGLRVGPAEIDFEAWRDRTGNTHFKVHRRAGKMRVVRQPPPNARPESPADLLRLAASRVIPL
jgi:hypothetical protein